MNHLHLNTGRSFPIVLPDGSVHRALIKGISIPGHDADEVILHYEDQGKIGAAVYDDFQANPQWHNRTAEAVMVKLLEEGMLAPSLEVAVRDLLTRRAKEGS